MVDADLKSRILAGFASAGEVFQRMANELKKFGDVYYAAVEQCYRQHHGRLPGGTRTARLRKKRRTKVLRWFMEIKP